MNSWTAKIVLIAVSLVCVIIILARVLPTSTSQSSQAISQATNSATSMQPDRLVVTRKHDNLNDLSPPPLNKTITDRATVIKLYADILALPLFPSGSGVMNCPVDESGIGHVICFLAHILALPLFPSGVMNCPVDVGIEYHLEFYSGDTSLLSADYAPSGCASVSLSNGAYKMAGTGSFEGDFIQALGFSEQQFLGLQ